MNLVSLFLFWTFPSQRLLSSLWVTKMLELTRAWSWILFLPPHTLPKSRFPNSHWSNSHPNDHDPRLQALAQSSGFDYQVSSLGCLRRTLNSTCVKLTTSFEPFITPKSQSFFKVLNSEDSCPGQIDSWISLCFPSYHRKLNIHIANPMTTIERTKQRGKINNPVEVLNGL
jgi:hypothetical protein